MRPRLRRYHTAGVVIVVAGLITIPPGSPLALDFQVRTVQLTSSDPAASPLGDGVALIMGPTGIPDPGERYLETADTLFLKPLGFTGTLEALHTPEEFYPDSGLNSLTADQSVAQGVQDLVSAVQAQIAAPGFSPENPVVVFGYSQSAVVASQAMYQLHQLGVPSQDVHFVLIGDTSQPDGGLFERLDLPTGTTPTFSSLGITFGDPTPSDYYPTNIFTNEYDGFANFPLYPQDTIAVQNALEGNGFEHSTYFGDTPGQIASAMASPLPGSAALTGEGMTDYYTIPANSLPFLDWLQFVPVIGKPLYDLLEPDTALLINLGYGCISDSFCGAAGPYDALTPVGLVPLNLDWGSALTGLVNGTLKGIGDFFGDLVNPNTYLSAFTPLVDNPVLQPLLESLYNLGITSTPDPSSLSEILAELPHTTPLGFSVLTPIFQTLLGAITDLPTYDWNIFWSELEHGDIISAIGLPFVADFGVIQYAVSDGIIVPLLEALFGTPVSV